jgi:hypothetical protein
MAEAKSPLLAGNIVPFAVRSLITNQLPGGFTLRILGEVPSESWAAVGLTPGGAFAAADSPELGLELDEEDEPFEHGQLTASGGTMQLDATIAKTTVSPSLAIGLFICAYLTEKIASRQDKYQEKTDVDRSSPHGKSSLLTAIYVGRHQPEFPDPLLIEKDAEASLFTPMPDPGLVITTPIAVALPTAV